jgi:F-type H+-transporting ATPase subunit b
MEENMVEINPPIFIIQIITFLIAMPLVWNLFIKALGATMKKRDDFIRDSIDKIEKDKADIEGMKTDYEKRLAMMEANTKEALAKALADGEKIKTGLVEEARAEGQKLITEAKAEIENEKKKAIEAVKDSIVDISIMAAEKAIKKKVTKKDQLAVVSKYMKDIEKANSN